MGSSNFGNTILRLVKILKKDMRKLMAFLEEYRQTSKFIIPCWLFDIQKKTPRLKFSRGNTWLEWLERGSFKLPFN